MSTTTGTTPKGDTASVKLNFATDWKYAPAPETAKVQLRARYDLFIDGKFTPPVKGKYFDTANPATEKKIAEETADRQAAAIRLEAYSIDTNFTVFWKKLKAFQDGMSRAGDMILLSSKHPLFDGILRPPGDPKIPSKSKD